MLEKNNGDHIDTELHGKIFAHVKITPGIL